MTLDLLPANATDLERELALLSSEIDAVDTDWIGTIWNADTCPPEMLPVLAYALSVDVWQEAWPESRKRRACREAPQYHRLKGTDVAVRMALGLLGCKVTSTEWHETNPPGRRGTFHVRAFVAERVPGAPVITPDIIAAARAAVMAAKPKSRSFTLDMGIGTVAESGVAGALATLTAAASNALLVADTNVGAAAGAAGALAALMAAAANISARAPTLLAALGGIAGGFAAVNHVIATVRTQ